jgi:hypothetical protein
VTSPDPAIVDQLTIRAQLGRVRELVPLSGGSNNRVFRADCEGGRAVLKCYFRSPADPRDRLGAEFAFCRYARAAGVNSVPEPLGCDAPAGLGLFEFVEGKRPDIATESLIAQAAGFVRAINSPQFRLAATALPLASEACFSVEEHLGVVGGRANRLGDITPESAVDRAALQFVQGELLPVWMAVRETTRTLAGEERFGRSAATSSRVVSPSDFGFHNALVGADGRATFLDFEYAGWDDPAKLICDFFCQPTVPVPVSYFERFSNAVIEELPDSYRILQRARLLLPVYRMKWVCIRMNEFLPGGSARRSFATQEALENRKEAQLASARVALAPLIRFERISA